MGRPQSITLGTTQTASAGLQLRRGADVVLSGLLLLVLAPLIAVLALAVRLSSHGPVLHREPGFSRTGRPVDLLAFRTMVDGGGTAAHAKVRAVVGAADAYTPVGRVIARLRLARLPRLFNVLRGDAGILG